MDRFLPVSYGLTIEASVLMQNYCHLAASWPSLPSSENPQHRLKHWG